MPDHGKWARYTGETGDRHKDTYNKNQQKASAKFWDKSRFLGSHLQPKEVPGFLALEIVARSPTSRSIYALYTPV